MQPPNNRLKGLGGDLLRCDVTVAARGVRGEHCTHARRLMLERAADAQQLRFWSVRPEVGLDSPTFGRGERRVNSFGGDPPLAERSHLIFDQCQQWGHDN